VQLFLLPFSSHCSTQNIGFNDSGYVIKPPQPSSVIYGAQPFTGNALKTIIIGEMLGTPTQCHTFVIYDDTGQKTGLKLIPFCLTTTSIMTEIFP